MFKAPGDTGPLFEGIMGHFKGFALQEYNPWVAKGMSVDGAQFEDHCARVII
jgi:hypothetical protein